MMATIGDEMPVEIGNFLCQPAQIGKFVSGAAPLDPAEKRAGLNRKKFKRLGMRVGLPGWSCDDYTSVFIM